MNIGQHEKNKNKNNKIATKNHWAIQAEAKGEGKNHIVWSMDKVGVTETWSNIIANLKWRLFSIVATSLFVIYFISLPRSFSVHSQCIKENTN